MATSAYGKEQLVEQILVIILYVVIKFINYSEYHS